MQNKQSFKQKKVENIIKKLIFKQICRKIINNCKLYVKRNLNIYVEKMKNISKYKVKICLKKCKRKIY